MFREDISRYRLILASRSPRRKQLLADAGLEFEVIVTDIPEEPPAGAGGEETAIFLAREKANMVKPVIKDRDIVISADTIVFCSGSFLGKPADEQEAFAMLSCISGKTHEVITGVCLLTLHSERTFAETTRVTFDNLSDEEIYYYINEYKPYDKAGAYGIQEWIGYIGCSRIEGSYFNVMGLPVHRVYRELEGLIDDRR